MEVVKDAANSLNGLSPYDSICEQVDLILISRITLSLAVHLSSHRI